MPTKVLLLYPDPPGFSGQRAASELIGELLRGDERFEFRRLVMPGFPKGCSGLVEKISYFFSLFSAYMGAIGFVWIGGIDVVHANLSQTKFGLIRKAPVIWLFRFLRPNTRLIASLHGSNFMEWNSSDSIFRLFRNIVRKASVVTVLGPNQKEKLEKLLGESGRVRILPNTCELEVVDAARLEEKHCEGGGTISALHLSTLMEAKGWITTVEALEILGDEVEGTICGLITSSSGEKRFRELKEAEEWLQRRADASQITWVKGAFGEAKAELFRQSDIFVFPSTYRTEAQPLVLLEALASGCAIVTSRVGEISWMVDESIAVFVSESPSAEEVANAIRDLSRDRKRRLSMVQQGRLRFLKQFSQSAYRDMWAELLSCS